MYPSFRLSATGGLSFSVEGNRHKLAERDDEAAAEEEKEVQYKLEKPDIRREIVQGICDDSVDLTPVAEITGLFKEAPQLQGEEFDRRQERKDQTGSHPAVGTEISVSGPVPVDGNGSGSGRETLRNLLHP